MTIYAIPQIPANGRSKFVPTTAGEKPLARKKGVSELAKLLNSGSVKVSPCQQPEDKDKAVLGPCASKDETRSEPCHAFLGQRNLVEALVARRGFGTIQEDWLLSVLNGKTSFMIIETANV